MRSRERVNIRTNERTYVRTHIHTYGTDPISPPQLCCARGYLAGGNHNGTTAIVASIVTRLILLFIHKCPCVSNDGVKPEVLFFQGLHKRLRKWHL